MEEDLQAMRVVDELQNIFTLYLSPKRGEVLLKKHWMAFGSKIEKPGKGCLLMKSADMYWSSTVTRENSIQSFSSLHNSDTLIDCKVHVTAGLLLFHYSLWPLPEMLAEPK